MKATILEMHLSMIGFKDQKQMRGEKQKSTFITRHEQHESTQGTRHVKYKST